MLPDKNNFSPSNLTLIQLDKAIKGHSSVVTLAYFKRSLAAILDNEFMSLGFTHVFKMLISKFIG